MSDTQRTLPAIWSLTAVPLEDDRQTPAGYVVPTSQIPKCDEQTLISPYCEFLSVGPCPWKNGQVVGPGEAARILGLVGEDADDIADIADYWKVRVKSWPNAPENLARVRWQWHWHAVAVPIDADGNEVDKDHWIGVNWTDTQPPCVEPCPWIDGQEVGWLDAADINGLDSQEAADIANRWRVHVSWHADEVYPAGVNVA